MHHPVAYSIATHARNRALAGVETLRAVGTAKTPDLLPRQAVMTVGDLSKRFHVSAKTISRWRQKGLEGRQYVVDGHRRLGFLPSEVDRFVQSHGEDVRRAGRFSQMTPAEREQIVSEARRLARVGHRPAEILRLLARQTSRSPETIRYTLKQADRQHPESRILSSGECPAGLAARREIYQHYLRGEPLGDLARRYGCGKAALLRVVAQQRLENLRELPLDYVPNEQFGRVVSAAEERAILGPTPPGREAPKKARRPAGLPPYLASLYEVPLLTREQEVHLFRKMNYLKHKACRLLHGVDPSRPSMAVLERIEHLYQQSVAAKNEIVRANLRLVVSIAKRYATASQGLFDLVSDGNMSLIRAVEKFDFARGFKFSTYATWAIVKNFARSIPSEQRYQNRFQTCRDEWFADAADERADRLAAELAQSRRETQVARILDHLDEREKQIVRFRFGLDRAQEPMTLDQVGAAMGVTKERVRQIESRALAKLRKAARDEKIEAADLGA